MSNRVLKQSICDSETVAALKEWGAEVTFCRVMVACCDDYGRFDARPAVVRAKCFPLVLDRVPEAQVDAWLLDLQRVGLVQLYDANGRRYGAMSKWANHQRVRNAVSKIPPPPVNNLLSIDGDSRTIAADCGLTPDTRHRTPDTRNQTTELGKASSDADARAVMTWFYGLWSEANGGKAFPKSAEGFQKARTNARRLLKDKPEGQSLEAFLAGLRPAALSALRGEFKAGTPGTLSAYVASRGKYTENNRFGGKPGKSPVDLGRYAR